MAAQKIALVSAFPYLRNPGMLSVEMAFMSIERTLGRAIEVSRFCSEQSFKMQCGASLYEWKHLQRAQQLESYDKIVYWGDFLHWKGYGEGDWLFRQKQRYPNTDAKALLDRWYDCLLLEGHGSLRRKTILFGGTLYCLSARDLVDERYRNALTELCRDAHLVQFRDQVSSSFIADLLCFDTNFYGCDSASLLETSSFPDLINADSEESPQDFLFFSFGRFRANPAFASLTHDLSNELGLAAVDVKWFQPKMNAQELLSNLSKMRKANAVITDIYHLAVSAFREGKPTLGIGRGCSYANGTLADKKKELLFREILAEQYYIYSEQIEVSLNLPKARRALVEHCAKQLQKRAEIELIHAQHAEHVARSKSRLLAALRE
jgi:hypothetical protein